MLLEPALIVTAPACIPALLQKIQNPWHACPAALWAPYSLCHLTQTVRCPALHMAQREVARAC